MSSWLITEKGMVHGTPERDVRGYQPTYGNFSGEVQRIVYKSSSGPPECEDASCDHPGARLTYNAYWLNRADNAEDPWISLRNHGDPCANAAGAPARSPRS